MSGLFLKIWHFWLLDRGPWSLKITLVCYALPLFYFVDFWNHLKNTKKKKLMKNAKDFYEAIIQSYLCNNINNVPCSLEYLNIQEHEWEKSLQS